MVIGVLHCIAKKRNNFHILNKTFYKLFQFYFKILGLKQCFEI